MIDCKKSIVVKFSKFFFLFIFKINSAFFSYNVPKKDVIEFNKEVGERLEKNNTPFSVGVQKALKYLNTGELPANWEKHFHSDRMETDVELNFSDVSIIVINKYRGFQSREISEQLQLVKSFKLYVSGYSKYLM